MQPAHDRASILLVDDRPENLAALEATLEPLGHRLVKADSGADALKHLLHRDFAAVLLDVRMPGMDGLETASLIRLREKTRHVPIIFITANARDQQQVLAAYSIGAVDYISKPFDPTILRSKLSIFVELYQKGEQIKRYAEEERRGMANRQRLFLKDVLASVTEGRLHLCDSPAELPAPLEQIKEPIPLTEKGALHELRYYAQRAATQCGFSAERWQDLVTAVGEAGMNAVMHGIQGAGTVCSDSERHVQVWIHDQGRGIDLERLPKATLERGYTTADSFGHGFWLMLKTVDHVWLLTGATGTTLVIEQSVNQPQPSWF